VTLAVVSTWATVFPVKRFVDAAMGGITRMWTGTATWTLMTFFGC
jgi:hypothetical protein